MLADGTLWIPTFGSFVTMSKSVLVVRLRKQVLFECPISIVDHVVIEADGVAMSSRAIMACAKLRIAIVFCRAGGLPVSHLVPARSDLRPGLTDQQLAVRSTARAAEIVAEMIIAKIRNQRALLLRASKYHSRPTHVLDGLRAAAAKLEQCADECASPTVTRHPQWQQQIRLVEARGAAWYWHAFAALVPPTLAFSRRHGRGASDIVIVLLNYDY